SGKDGYTEFYGLQDQVEGNRSPIFRGARKGKDVTLTLDIDVQRAAEEVLSNPAQPEAFDKDLAEMLAREFPGELSVLHRVFVTTGVCR
ncbi:MAG: hypothetical protein AB8H79_20965, partial [Myxococcota bacterium]